MSESWRPWALQEGPGAKGSNLRLPRLSRGARVSGVPPSKLVEEELCGGQAVPGLHRSPSRVASRGSSSEDIKTPWPMGCGEYPAGQAADVCR